MSKKEIEKFKKSLHGSGFSARNKIEELTDLLYSEIERVSKPKKAKSKKKAEPETETKTDKK